MHIDSDTDIHIRTWDPSCTAIRLYILLSQKTLSCRVVARERPHPVCMAPVRCRKYYTIYAGSSGEPSVRSHAPSANARVSHQPPRIGAVAGSALPRLITATMVRWRMPSTRPRPAGLRKARKADTILKADCYALRDPPWGGLISP